MFYLLVWRCLKVKSSVSRTDGSEETNQSSKVQMPGEVARRGNAKASN